MTPLRPSSSIRCLSSPLTIRPRRTIVEPDRLAKLRELQQRVDLPVVGALDVLMSALLAADGLRPRFASARAPA